MSQAEISLQFFLDLLPDLLCVCDRDGYFLKINSTWTDVLGWSLEDLQKRNWRELIYPEDKKADLELLAFAEIANQTQQLTNRYEHKNGSYRWLNWRLLKAPDQLIYGIAQDITDKVIAEETLQGLQSKLAQYTNNLDLKEKQLHTALAQLQTTEQELIVQKAELNLTRCHVELEHQRYKDLFDSAPDGYLVTDAWGTIQEANKAIADLLGCAQASLIGKSLNSFVPLTEKQNFRDIIQNIDALEQTSNYELHLQSKQQRLFTASIAVATINNSQGKLVGLRWSIHDITESKRIEQALNNSESRYRAIVEDQTELICRFLPNFTLTFVNDACCRFLGKSKLELLGKSFVECFCRGKTELSQQLAELNPDYPFAQMEYSIELANGELRWEKWIHRAIFDDQGKLFEYQAVGRDVTNRRLAQESLEKIKAELEIRVQERTEELNLANEKLQKQILERQQAEEVIRQSWRKYRSVIDSLREVVFQRDAENRWTFLSPAWTDMTGFSIGETLNTYYLDYIHPEDRPGKQKLWQELVSGTKNSFHQQIRYLTSDGGYRWAEVHGRVSRDEHGCITGTAGTISDITERKQAEQKLHNVLKELEFQKLALDHVGLVSIADRDGILTYVNERFCQVSQYTREELLGQRTYPHPLMSTDHYADELFAEIWSNITTGKIWQGEIRNRAKDGSYYWLDKTIVPFLDASGQPFQYLAISFEITQLKQAEAALRSQAEQLFLLSQVAQRIRQSLNINDVSNATVNEVRQLLKVDRVVVYRFDSSTSGTIVAESVLPEFPSIINKYIENNDIPEEIQKLYCQGRTRAISDIYAANLADCHLELLEGFAVKANLVVPIILNGQHSSISYQLEDGQGNSLWGLLVAHQCRTTRHWQDTELELLNQIAVQLAIALQQADAYGQAQSELVERKHAQEALRSAQERLQYLLSSSPAVIYTRQFTTCYCTTFISANVSAIVGYSDQEFLAEPRFWLDRIHPQDRSMVLDNLAVILNQNSDFILEYRFLHKKGKYIWLRDELRVLYDAAGNTVEIIGSFIDITERKRAEEEIRNALAKEKELSELKSRFVSMASHEFRTPLTTILSSAELLEHYEWSEEEEKEQLQQIQIEVKHMTDLLESVLIIGKADANKLQLNPAPLDVIKFCYGIVKQLQHGIGCKHEIDFRITQEINAEESDSSDVETVQYIPESPEATMTTIVDEKLLRHILTNLLTNAIKYSPPGSSVLFTLNFRNQEIVFEIADSGIGIPPEDLQHLFESFHRAHNVGNIPGTGLGLAIVKRCVDIHRGSIMVTSQLDIGTTFRVTIPLIIN